MRLSIALLFGTLVLLAGVSIILTSLFNIHVPLVRTAFAFLLVFIGIRVFVGAWQPARSEPLPTGSALLSERLFAPSGGDRLKYDVVFGRGVVDLTALPEAKGDTFVEVNSVFGAALVEIDPSAPIEVEGSAAFGDVRMPNLTSAAFGAIRYRPPGQHDAAPKIHLKVNAVFGSAEVRHHARSPVLESHVVGAP